MQDKAFSLRLVSPANSLLSCCNECLTVFVPSFDNHDDPYVVQSHTANVVSHRPRAEVYVHVQSRRFYRPLDSRPINTSPLGSGEENSESNQNNDDYDNLEG